MILQTMIVSACDDINYSVRSLQKDDSGCYTMIVFSINKLNCTDTCFSEFNSAKYSTNTGQMWNFKISSPSQMSNPFITYISTVNCSKGIPYDFYANLVGETKNCTFSFRFEDEYQAYLEKLAAQEKKLAEEQRLWAVSYTHLTLPTIYSV